MNLKHLRLLGFDRASHVPFTNQFKVRCSCCETLVIYGVPTHETGCPNAMKECLGCGKYISVSCRFCNECFF